MAKAIVKQVTKALPQIIQLSQNRQSLTIDFDKEADVLYISFQDPKAATDTEIVNDDILLRKHKDTIVGITVMHASNYR